MATSSTRYSSEIRPDYRLRLAVAASGALCLLVAPALGALAAPGWRVPATASVFALTAVELTHLIRCQRAASRYRLYGDGSIEARMAEGREVVSAMFVIPYPPGFPILVPGQVISKDIMAFMRALDVKEIHGYRPELGLRVFTEAALGGESTTEKSAAE